MHFEGEILEDPERSRRLIGRLLYINLTRPDITFTLKELSTRGYFIQLMLN